jgi:hypothetical protein
MLKSISWILPTNPSLPVMASSPFSNEQISQEATNEQQPAQHVNYDDPNNIPHDQLPDDVIEKLRMEQQLLPAIGIGLIVGLIGAALWGAITVDTNFQIGYMAVAIGAGIGFSMRYVGKGIDQLFGVLGAIIALLSCALGNFFSVIGFYANSEHVGFLETLMVFDWTYLPDVMIETFSGMDVVFYAIAMYEGYKFSFRIVTRNDIR